VPFQVTFPKWNLSPGTNIYIKGISKPGANRWFSGHSLRYTHIIWFNNLPAWYEFFFTRFHVNFLKLETQAYVLHFDVRFDQGVTVRNTKFPSWGTEERTSLPIYRGASFTINIRVLHDRYQISINRIHHCDFVHRIPCVEANALKIDGDVTIQQVKFFNWWKIYFLF